MEIDNMKILKALGFQQIPRKNCVDPRTAIRMRNSLIDMETLIWCEKQSDGQWRETDIDVSSLHLSKKIKEKVVNLWVKGVHGKYPWRDIEIIVDTYGYSIFLMHYRWCGEHTEDQMFTVIGVPESEMWATTLVWLDETLPKFKQSKFFI
jgi:hypothetical protein